MKVMVFGAGGMIGQEVCRQLRDDTPHHPIMVGRGDGFDRRVDLNYQQSIGSVLQSVRPDAVINCAGAATGKANPPYESFGVTILEQVAAKRIDLQRCVLMGSVAVMGAVPQDRLPVEEYEATHGTLPPYAYGKVVERLFAGQYNDRKIGRIPVTIAQAGNIVGRHMPEKQLLAQLMERAAKARDGEPFEPVRGPLESRRGYLHAEDIAWALIQLATEQPRIDDDQQPAFLCNVGADDSMSNGELAELVAQAYELGDSVQLMKNEGSPDLYASRVDTSRIRIHFGWVPQYFTSRLAVGHTIEQANQS